MILTECTCEEFNSLNSTYTRGNHKVVIKIDRPQQILAFRTERDKVCSIGSIKSMSWNEVREIVDALLNLE